MNAVEECVDGCTLAPAEVSGREQVKVDRDSRITLSVILAVAVTLTMWASAFSAIRASLSAYGPAHLALLRFLIASVVLACAGAVRGMRWPRRQDWAVIVVAGLLGVTVYQISLNYAEVTISAGAACLLVNTAPIFVAVLATIFLKERFGVRGWVGSAISFGGIVLIAVGEEGGLSFGSRAPFILLCAVAAAIYTTVQKRMLSSLRYTAQEYATLTIWAGTALMLPFAGGLWDAILAAPMKATASVLYLGIFPGAIAASLWGFVISRMPASRASNLLYLAPALAFTIAWVWLGEKPTTLAVAGGALVVAGVVVVNARR